MFLHRQLPIANFSDFTIFDHVINKADVADEFECQLKCMGNNSCNTQREGNNAKKLCELNNKARQMKPGDFKRKKGSTYYGSVQVSWKYVSGVHIFLFIFESDTRRRQRNKKSLWWSVFKLEIWGTVTLFYHNYHHKLILVFIIITFLWCKEEQLTEKFQLQKLSESILERVCNYTWSCYWFCSLYSRKNCIN